MNAIDAWPTRGLPLNVAAFRATGLSPLHLSTHVAPMFFLRRAPALESTMPPLATRVGADSDFTGDLVVLVLPLRKRAESEHAFISIGRLERNDVALADPTVSKFHAYIHVIDGALLLQDARSRNGTKVDGELVAPRGSGAPTRLHDGAHVEFGSVALSCVSPESLLHIMASLVPTF